MLAVLVIGFLIVCLAGIIGIAAYFITTRIQVENTKVKLAKDASSRQADDNAMLLESNRIELEKTRMQLIHEQTIKKLELGASDQAALEVGEVDLDSRPTGANTFLTSSGDPLPPILKDKPDYGRRSPKDRLLWGAAPEVEILDNQKGLRK